MGLAVKAIAAEARLSEAGLEGSWKLHLAAKARTFEESTTLVEVLDLRVPVVRSKAMFFGLESVAALVAWGSFLLGGGTLAIIHLG